MRTGIYNRYWTTGGGAEKYGGVLAQLLSSRGPVELLTHEGFDLDWLAERLSLDLSGCRLRLTDDRDRAVQEAAAASDLFVNVTFMSHVAAPHDRSLYVVHFPAGPKSRRWPRGRITASMEWGTGFHEGALGLRSVVWTDGEATLRIVTEASEPVPVRLYFGGQRPAAAGPADLRVLVAGEEVGTCDLDAPPTRLQRLAGRVVELRVASPDAAVPVEVTIRSSTFVPADLDGGNDKRTLGVPLMGIQIGDGVEALVGRVAPTLVTPPMSHAWTSTYGKVVSNSRFTQTWVRRRWEVESDVLYPPVSRYERGAKAPVILGVGRFFPVGQGHSKKQLELVRAFRKLVDGGVSGWTLHLAGGCAPDGRGYLAEVEALASGYPVVFHVNASGAELRELYGSASIYWHAAGFGLDVSRHPDDVEHFGISTVEAMSAGAVPLVLGVGGLVESVRHGVDGYHFKTLDGLVAMTRTLLDDDAQRARMSASSERRAQDFGLGAFAARLDCVLAELGLG